MWWSWTASGEAPVSVTTAGSDFDTLLGIYAGSAESFAGLRVVAANDDVSPSDLTSQVIFQPETRTTYYIAIDGYGSATGNVRLELRPASAAVLAIRLKKPDLVSLLISNTSARPMILQASPDLANWTPFSTNLIQNGPTEWTSSVDRGQLHRFFRAVPAD